MNPQLLGLSVNGINITVIKRNQKETSNVSTLNSNNDKMWTCTGSCHRSSSFFSNSCLVPPCWLRRLQFNQNFHFSTVHFPISLSFFTTAPGLSSGFNFSKLQTKEISASMFTILKSFAGNMGKTLNNNDLGPVSRTSRNFSGDINPFISSVRTCLKLWNLVVILPFLVSETY